MVENKVMVDGREEIHTVRAEMKEYIHPVVYHDRDSEFSPRSYNPAVLDGYIRIDINHEENEKGYIYYKKDVPAEKSSWPKYIWSLGYAANSTEARTIEIPEFVIPPENKYEKFESLERRLIDATPLLQKQKSSGERLTGKEQETLDLLLVQQRKAREFLKRLDEGQKLASERG